MCEKTRNVVIFPNLVVNDIMAVTVRTFQPTARRHGRDRVGAGPRRGGRREAAPPPRLLPDLPGTGGFATPDDIEAIESCQQGFRSGGVEWSDLSRGMRREPRGHDELQMRCFWRRWHSLVAGTAYVEQYERGLPPGAVPSPELTAAAEHEFAR